MEPDNNSVQQSPASNTARNPTSPYSALIGLLIIVFLIIGGYIYLQGTDATLGLLGAKQEAVVPSDLQGVLFLSAITTATSTGEVTGVVPLMVKVSSGRGGYVPFDQLASGPIISLQFAAASDLSSAVFLGTPIVDGDVAQPVPSIYYADLSGAKASDDGISLVQNAIAIAPPTASDYFRESPAVSASHIVAYASLSETQHESAQSSLESLRAEDWTIYAVDANSPDFTQKIADGLAPKWVNEHLLAYLKNDGMYVYDFVTKEERQVWSLDFIPNLATGFDVSNDGKFVVVTHPENSTFVVLRALDWATSLVTEMAQVRRSVTSPVFAPDNSYIAMFGVGAEGSTQIMYYSPAKNAFLDETVSFDPASFGGLYMTDWR